MIQAESTLKVGDNTGAKNFYVSVCWVVLNVVTHQLVISSLLRLKKQHQAALSKKVMLSKLLLSVLPKKLKDQTVHIFDSPKMRQLLSKMTRVRKERVFLDLLPVNSEKKIT